MRKSRLVCLLGIALLGILTLPGCLLTNIKTPLDTDLDRTQLGAKVGEASTQSILWAVAWGDAGTQAAARNGNITTVKHADQKIFTILGGLYSRYTTVVYGD